MGYDLLDLIGNFGVVVLIATYLLLQLNRINSAALSYSLLNMVGAALILVSLSTKFNLSAFVIEAFWVLISLIGVARSLKAGSTSSLKDE